MEKFNYLSLDSSILYRCSQKYFDKALSEYGLGYAHVLFLTLIYENEGISMVDLAHSGSFDKGTITKSIQKLEDIGYVRIENDSQDKRRKLLYSTEKAHHIMSTIYKLKQKWWDYLLQDLSPHEVERIKPAMSKILNRCRDYSLLESYNNKIRFYGIQKLSLLDYPGNMASTLFTGGCNLRCPFCHNRDLVFLKENMSEISLDDIMSFLSKRSKLLDGICISGGEPLLNEGLKDFIIDVKSLGLKVKLDTNGTNYRELKELLDEQLLDYVAMDIKNSLDKYPKTVDIENFDISNIVKCINLLMQSNIDYEFRTTIVEEFHDKDSIIDICNLIKGAKNYYLQPFVDSQNCIKSGLHAPSNEKLYEYLQIAKKYVNNASIRGLELEVYNVSSH